MSLRVVESALEGVDQAKEKRKPRISSNVSESDVTPSDEWPV